jgi:hypothetical protein
VASSIRSLAAHIFRITLDNFHDEVFGTLLGLNASNEVDWAEPVNALILTNDIYVATAPFLQISNGLATSSYD